MDYSSFTDANFDSKKWINNAIKTSKSESTESLVSSMIMGLQLLSQEVSSAFEETSSQTLVRMPRALMEIERMAKEARRLRQSLNTILQAEDSTSQATNKGGIGRMTTLHAAKTKLDVCQQTIEEAVYLSQNVKTMNAIFEKGDTVQIGAEISKMQLALQRLNEYPDQHSKFSSSIARFEEKLVNLVESDCLHALINREVQSARDHLNTLQSIGKADAVVCRFIEQSIPKVLESWQSFETADEMFSSWLPLFFSVIKSFIGREKSYYVEVFGTAAYAVRITDLIGCILQSLKPSFESRIADLSLPELVKSHATTALLYSYCNEELSSHSASSDSVLVPLRSSLATRIYEPFLPTQRQYSTLEKAYLQSCIKQFGWTSSNPNLTPALVNTVAESTSQVFVFLEDALNRCVEFTECMECQGLVNAMNDVLVEFAESIRRLVKRDSVDFDNQSGQTSLKHAPPVSPLSPPKSPIVGLSPPEASSSAVKVGLHLHQVCSTMIEKLMQIEAAAKGLILSQRAALLGKTRPRPRLWTEGRASAIAPFLNSLDGLKLSLCPAASKEFQGLLKEVERSVFDSLFGTVKHWLTDVCTMEIWNHPAEEGATADHPLEYIRSIGDYLFDLPMLILSQAPGNADTIQGEEEPDDASRSGHWVDMVVRGAVDLLVRGVEQIPALSALGSEQLATDVDYFKNVLARLSDTLYPVLDDLLAMLQCPTADCTTTLGALHCREKLHFFKQIRAKRLPVDTTLDSASL